MSRTFTKLFSSIVASTVWCEDSDTKVTWVTMLAICDRHGVVSASIPGLAGIARVSVESCRAAVAKFLAPDPDSRTRDFEGRRIIVVEGGWRLLNYAYYRGLMDEESRREYKSKWMRDSRGHEKSTVDKVDAGGHKQKQKQIKKEETDLSDAQPSAAVGLPAVSAAKPKKPKPGSESPAFTAFYTAYPRHEAREDAWKAWKQADLEERSDEVAEVMAAVARQRKDGCLVARSVDGRSTVPLPASWLRGKRWKDAPNNGAGKPGASADTDHGYADVDPQQQRVEAARMDANEAWSDVRTDLKLGFKAPSKAGPPVVAGLEAIGGYNGLIGMQPHSLHNLAAAFVKAYVTKALRPA